MSKTRTLIVVTILTLISVGLVSAQVVPTVSVGERVLVNITSAGQSFAYEFDNEAESDTAISVTYLGQPFPLLTEWYDSRGTLLATLSIQQAGPSQPLRLPSDTILILISADGSAIGRALFSLEVDAPGTDATSDGAVTPDMQLGEPAEDMLGPGDPHYGQTFFDGMPASGDWTLSYIDHENNCPNDILFENIWMAANGSTHRLDFSGSPDDVPLTLHRVVAPDELDEMPEFFMVETDDTPNSWLVIPGIQTAPYTYRYTIHTPDYVELTYTEQLALSDCALHARYALTLDGAAVGIPATAPGVYADLTRWTTMGDATEPTFTASDYAPDGMLCATDLTQGETWYFAAPPELVETISTGYGMTLEFALRLDDAGAPYEDIDVMLTIGNGLVLAYHLDEMPTTDWTRFQIPLTADAGWFDLDGMFEVDDPAMFEELLSYATQLHIRGEYLTGADSACLANVAVTPLGG